MPGETFDRARNCDVTVHTMLREGQPLEAIVGRLSAEKERLLAHVHEIHMLIPKKLRLADGSVWIWRCPEGLIPEGWPRIPG